MSLTSPIAALALTQRAPGSSRVQIWEFISFRFTSPGAGQLRYLKLLLPLHCILLFFLSCADNASIAGAGVESTNGFSGLVTDTSGAPVVSARVTWRPSDYLLSAGTALPKVSAPADTGSVLTGADGRYVAAGAGPGDYTVSIRAPDGRAHLFDQTISQGQDTINTGTQVVQSTGEVAVDLRIPGISGEVTVQIYGMDVRIGGAAGGTAVIPGLAPAPYRFKITSAESRESANVDDVIVTPLARTIISNVDVSAGSADVSVPSRFARDSALVHTVLLQSGALRSVAWDSIVHVDNGRITGLFLGGVPLDSLPGSVGDLTFIDTLMLNGTQITSLPEALFTLSGLKALNLSYNMGLMMPDVLYALTSLEYLNLSGLGLISFDVRLIGLMGLKILILKDNGISILPAAVSGLTALEGLELQNNLLDSVPAALMGMPGLKWLFLSGNRITALPDVFSSAHQMEKLFLDGNLLSELPQSIVLLPSLLRLQLGGNRLCTVPADIQTFIDSVPLRDDWVNLQLGC